MKLTMFMKVSRRNYYRFIQAELIGFPREFYQVYDLHISAQTANMVFT